jgi:hypothetical protein
MNAQNTDDPDTLQRMSKAMVAELRRAYRDANMTTGRDANMTTGKVSRVVTDAVNAALQRTGVVDSAALVKDIHASIKGNDNILKRLVMQFVSLKGWDKK